MTHQFASPSFSGVGTSSHYLTIENQEFNRREQIRKDATALFDKEKRDEKNSTLARFLRNLESRVYAQLSRQLVDQLFGEDPSTEGLIVDGDMITLTITDSEGNVTTITVPIGSFTF